LKKAHGAPFSWEKFNCSTPQTKPESDKIGGMSREAIYPHSHFHIFASLPGLNDAATNRQRVRIYCKMLTSKATTENQKSKAMSG